MDELYIDISKGFAGGGVPGRLNTAKLVRRMVQVHGKNGKIFTRMQWVKPWEASTGHGVRAIHNEHDYHEAKEDGVFEHPDAHNALAHQGIHNAEHLLQSMHHEHPIYLPETRDSGEVAEAMGSHNHIRHGASGYDRHQHTDDIHYDKPKAEQEQAATQEHSEIKLPNDWKDMDATQLAQYANQHYQGRYNEFANALEQAYRDDNEGSLSTRNAIMLDDVSEKLGSRHSEVKLPELWNLKTSSELTSYAKEHLKPDQYGDFMNKLELEKRRRHDGKLSELDDLVLDMVRENLGLQPDNTREDDDELYDEEFDFDNAEEAVNWYESLSEPHQQQVMALIPETTDPDTMSAAQWNRVYHRFQAGEGSSSGTSVRDRIRDGSPSDVLGEFQEDDDEVSQMRTLETILHFHGKDDAYRDVINKIAKKLGLDAKDMKDLANDALGDHERKIRSMARGRVQSEAKPKSKAISEQAKPLDINQIRKDYAGGDLEDLHNSIHGDVLVKREKELLSDLFDEMSVPALEHIFSHPDGDYTVKLTDMQVRNTNKVKLDGRINDRDGNAIGFMNRSVNRKSDGTYHVHNDLLSIQAGKDNGIATHLYHRSEQLWKYLAGKGNKVEVSVYANISIGTYAWASKHKGFDFDSTYERDTKRKELKEFIKLNGWKEDEVLKSCGYTDINDLNHAWQFAELDDGYTYDLTPHGFNDRTGKAHLGKAFMLTHAQSWSGMKYINADGSVDRQKHIDSLVSKYHEDTGNWDFNDPDDEEEPVPAPDWYNNLSDERRDQLNRSYPASPDIGFGPSDWEDMRGHYNRNVRGADEPYAENTRGNEPSGNSNIPDWFANMDDDELIDFVNDHDMKDENYWNRYDDADWDRFHRAYQKWRGDK